MVRLHSLTKEQAKQLGFKSQKQLVEFVKDKIEQYQNKTHLQIQQEVKMIKDRQARELAQKLEDEKNARPLNDAKLQQADANHHKVRNFAKRADDDPNKFRPKFIQLMPNQLLKPGPRMPITSNTLHLINQSVTHNAIVFTQVEHDNFMSNIHNALIAIGLGHFFSELHFHQFDIYSDDELGLYYVLNGFFYDQGAWMLAKMAEEAPILLDNNNNMLNCVLGCIQSQVKQHLGVRRLNKLHDYNAKDISIDKVLEIAKDLKINITIYDSECAVWREYKDESFKGHDCSNNVGIIIKNGHAYNLKKKYKGRKDLSLHNKPEKLTVDPLSGELQPTFYGIFEFTNVLIFSNTMAINQIQEGVYYCTNKNQDFKKIVEFLVSKNIYPGVTANRNDIVCLDIRLDNPKRDIQLRNVNYKHEYLELVPSTYNLTLASVGMYLFRNFIQTSLLKMNDPVVTRVFKQLTSPRVEMKTIHVKSQYVYIIDLNKAYRSMCKNIGLFNKQADIRSVGQLFTIDSLPLRAGIYHFDDKWMTHEYLTYYLQKNHEYYIDWAIYYDFTSNIVSDFADALYNDQLIVKDTIHKKRIFNSLIGRFNPHPDEQSQTIIQKSEFDVSRFVLSGDKNIQYILDMSNDSYLISFTYNDIHYRGDNLPHITAQIVQRCKLMIEQTRDRILTRYPTCDIIGSMTDSLIFTNTEPIDFAACNINISDAIGDYSVISGQYFMSAGIGQYSLYNLHEGGIKVHQVLKLQGISNEKERTLDTLAGLFAELNKQKKGKLQPIIDFNPMNTQQHKLIIGEAGVGKSRYIKENFKNVRNYLRLSPTGVSACSIQATTISSFFCLGALNDKTIAESYKEMTTSKKHQIMLVKTIIIDEAYTASLNVMEKVNQLLKLVCGSHQDFANKQLILVGDDRQLPSVSAMFIGSDLYNRLKVELSPLPFTAATSRLTAEYRQIINYLRTDRTGLELINFIKAFKGSNITVDGLNVFYENAQVDVQNELSIEQYPGDMILVGDKKYKPMMPIILTRNHDIKEGTYNGRICKILSYSAEGLKIQLNGTTSDGIPYTRECMLAGYHDWKPAFAITIHKVQGLTLDSINIYITPEQCNNPNATRLLYVALTRVRSPENIHIRLI